MPQKLYKLVGEHFWRLTDDLGMMLESTARKIEIEVDFRPPVLTPTYYWTVSSEGGLWRMTNRRYATETEVRLAMACAATSKVLKIAHTELKVERFTPAVDDFTEGDRQIRHSGGCDGEHV